MDPYYVEHIQSAVFFAALAIAFNAIALYKKFYKLPQNLRGDEPKISLLQVIGPFSIYVITFFILTPLICYYTQKTYYPLEKLPFSFLGAIQFFSAGLCFFFSICFPFVLTNLPLVE